MKYIVMECHAAYSVLMDEESRFVRAANMHYQTGQVVENPILMDCDREKKPITVSHSFVKKVSAIAACLFLVLGIGTYYYRTNLMTYSTILISSEAEISLELNSKGRVIAIKGVNQLGKDFLLRYDFEEGDRYDVERKLVESLVSCGYLKTGDTVEFFIDSPKDDIYDDYSRELCSIIQKAPPENVKLNVQVYRNRGDNNNKLKEKKNEDNRTTTTVKSAQTTAPATSTTTVTRVTKGTNSREQYGDNTEGQYGDRHEYYPSVTRPPYNSENEKTTMESMPAVRPGQKPDNSSKPDNNKPYNNTDRDNTETRPVKPDTEQPQYPTFPENPWKEPIDPEDIPDERGPQWGYDYPGYEKPGDDYPYEDPWEKDWENWEDDKEDNEYPEYLLPTQPDDN